MRAAWLVVSAWSLISQACRLATPSPLHTPPYPCYPPGLQRGKTVRQRQNSESADPAPDVELLASPTNTFSSKPSVVSWVNPGSPRGRAGDEESEWVREANTASLQLVDGVIASVEAAAMLEEVNAEALSIGV